MSSLTKMTNLSRALIYFPGFPFLPCSQNCLLFQDKTIQDYKHSLAKQETMGLCLNLSLISQAILPSSPRDLQFAYVFSIPCCIVFLREISLPPKLLPAGILLQPDF